MLGWRMNSRACQSDGRGGPLWVHLPIRHSWVLMGGQFFVDEEHLVWRWETSGWVDLPHLMHRS